MWRRIFEFLIGGTHSLNEAEQRILAAVEATLSEADRATLLHQVGMIRKVQRSNPGRMVNVYYRSTADVPRLPFEADQYCLAEVNYRSAGRDKTTSVVLHRGRLMSFERNVPQASGEIESVTSVRVHPKGWKSVTDEIDAEEHDVR